MVKRILKIQPVFKVGDVLVNRHTGSTWTITRVTQRALEGILKRVDRDVPYPHNYDSTEPVDWSRIFLQGWEFQDDDFTRWIKEIREKEHGQ